MIKFTILLIYILYSSCFAQLPKEINLEADEIEYSNNKENLSAKGNVLLNTKTTKINTETLHFNSTNLIVITFSSTINPF